MHEISVAYELTELIRRYLPSGAELAAAKVRIGPMHGVNSDALEWAWEVVKLEAGWPTAKLMVDSPPWLLRCPKCGRTWQPVVIDERCTCGELHTQIVGGNEFMLVAIDIRDDYATTDGADTNTANAPPNSPTPVTGVAK
jgi:Zn finger protein HypA/HybF involved in hydrogenase expression